MKQLNKVQLLALSLIREDAKFIYTFVEISRNQKKLNSNYICMLLPYIGIFAHGSEMWGKKVNLDIPIFNEKERQFYTNVRQSHKLFEMNYTKLKEKINLHYKKADYYFQPHKKLFSKTTDKYYNVGYDICNEKYCGNTILIDTYLPDFKFGTNPIIYKRISIIVGQLVNKYMCGKKEIYNYDVNLNSSMFDFNFSDNKIFVDNSIETFSYFTILCAINFIIEFIDKLFIDEIPQKLKYSYILYYYLCGLVDEINIVDGTKFVIDNTLVDSRFRNCIAHYGLGQIMTSNDIIEDDLFGGLTNKIFNMNYLEVKNFVYEQLQNLEQQIENIIFLSSK